MGLRAWTHGYDLYAPARSVMFHEYAAFSSRRKKVRSHSELCPRLRSHLCVTPCIHTL